MTECIDLLVPVLKFQFEFFIREQAWVNAWILCQCAVFDDALQTCFEQRLAHSVTRSVP